MIKSRCHYFAKANNELDLASFLLDEDVRKPLTAYAAKRHEGRPDLLALELTGDHELWWAVLRLNNVEDPFNDVEKGMVLEMPRTERLADYFVKKT